MADTEAKETKVASTPEKKVVDEEKKEVAKETPTKEVGKEPELVDEDSKASENGNGDAKENGSSEEKDDKDKEVESTNGDSTDAPTDTSCIKRKSTGADVTDDASKDPASPAKKAKLDETPAAVEAETNGDA